LIDLRSDTVTKPSPEMMQAVLAAPLGDDVYGEDPTVNALESLVAEITGKEAAVFAPTATQANLLALLSHCQRGDEYIAGQDAHVYRYEGGGAAVLGGIQPQPIPFNGKGELDLDEVRRKIKADDIHFARTRLVCLENTQGGKALAMNYLSDYAKLADSHNLRKHLDGARMFNAVVKLSVDAKDICRHFDTVSVCLSKGLGAPAGAVWGGAADTIQIARRWRKTAGGGMRQAGILAAAGIYALENNIERLRDDHENAALLAKGLSKLAGFALLEKPQTNMVMLKMQRDRYSRLKSWLKEHDVIVTDPRWVCHMNVSAGDVERVLDHCREFDATD
jgi:threonine aldolase